MATGVVLVDDGDGAQVEQASERGAGVEISGGVLGVGQRRQDLAGGEATGAERLGPGAGERDLADGAPPPGFPPAGAGPMAG